jgi:hypothetical protein
MKQNGQDEELQSRRDFFKKAAQKALPILGAVVLASTPLLSHAANHVRAAVLAHARVVAKDHVRKPAVVLALVVAEVVAIKI